MELEKIKKSWPVAKESGINKKNILFKKRKSNINYNRTFKRNTTNTVQHFKTFSTPWNVLACLNVFYSAESGSDEGGGEILVLK